MKLFAATLFSFCLAAAGAAGQQAAIGGENSMSKSEDMRAVAPALERYAQNVVLGDVWKRTGLSSRDRSVVTLSALIARNQTIELPHYLGLALDNGVKADSNASSANRSGFNVGRVAVAGIVESAVPCLSRGRTTNGGRVS